MVKRTIDEVNGDYAENMNQSKVIKLNHRLTAMRAALSTAIFQIGFIFENGGPEVTPFTEGHGALCLDATGAVDEDAHDALVFDGLTYLADYVGLLGHQAVAYGLKQAGIRDKNIREYLDEKRIEEADSDEVGGD